MFKFLFTIVFLFCILAFLLGFSVIRTFKTLFFGSPKNKNRQQSTSQSRRRPDHMTDKRPSHKKVIPEKEGEYVDYEEIKD